MEGNAQMVGFNQVAIPLPGFQGGAGTEREGALKTERGTKAEGKTPSPSI